MAQATTVTVFDGAATPVVHNFTHLSSKDSGDASRTLWRELLPTVAEEGQVQLFQERGLNKKTGITRVVSGVQFPVLEAIATGGTTQGYLAGPRRAHLVQHALVTNLHSRATELESRIAYMILMNWMRNLATTQTPVDTGYLADLHQRRVIAL